MSLVAYSLLFGWIFSVGRGSALLAGLMHAAANGTVPLTWGIDPVRVREMRGIAFAILAVVVLVLAWRVFLAPVRTRPPSTRCRSILLRPSPDLNLGVGRRTADGVYL